MLVKVRVNGQGFEQTFQLNNLTEPFYTTRNNTTGTSKTDDKTERLSDDS